MTKTGFSSSQDTIETPKTVDIFVRTYIKDYAWLRYLWRSMLKYGVTGFRSIVIVHPPGQYAPEPPPFPHVIIAEDRTYSNDYYGQMITKMRAAEYTDADEVVYLDSDCVFICPVDFQTWKAPLLTTPWDEVGSAICWKSAVETMLGFVSPFETMRGFPFSYPRDFIAEVMAHVGGVERLVRMIDAWVLRPGHHPIIEFDAMGNYAVMKCPERFWIVPTGPEMPPSVIKQFWSWGGFTPAVIDEMERMGL